MKDKGIRKQTLNGSLFPLELTFGSGSLNKIFITDHASNLRAPTSVFFANACFSLQKVNLVLSARL